MKKLFSILFMVLFFVGISYAQTNQKKISVVDPNPSGLGCVDKFETAVAFSTNIYMLGLASCDLANLLEPDSSSYELCNTMASDAFDANIAASFVALNNCFGLVE